MTTPTAAKLRRNAEAHLRKRQTIKAPASGGSTSPTDALRLLHELQVHQVELEMQNAELLSCRQTAEAALEKYSDLYEFAPIGYFTLDEQGAIMEANLRGAVLLGVARSRLIVRRLQDFVAPASQTIFLSFLKNVFSGPGKQSCEVSLLKADGSAFWGDLHAAPADARNKSGTWCRVVVSDITAIKRGTEAQHRAEALVAANRNLQREIARRQTVENALKESQRHQHHLLVQSHHMQDQLRHLSRRLLIAQEEERKKISRELHDEIAQTLTGINVRLVALKAEATRNAKGLQTKITSAQRLVEKSVDIVHRFARNLRPTVLDDLGLIPALHSFMKQYTKETGIRVSLTVFSGVAKLDSAKRVVLYRIVQEALTNVARHAQASKGDVIIERIADDVCMQITDNGQSFDVEKVLHSRKIRRLGLLGMRERVEMVGGHFNIESIPGKGTTIKAQIPFRNGTKDEAYP